MKAAPGAGSEYEEPYEVAQLLRAQILRPWSWVEWRALPGRWVLRFLEVWEILAARDQVDAGDIGGNQQSRNPGTLAG